MQARSIEALRARKLKKKDLAKRIERSVSAVGHALRASPPQKSDTLQDIFNYFFPPQDEVTLALHARQLALQAPETAALLSAVFRDLADLLVSAPEVGQFNPDKQRS